MADRMRVTSFMLPQDTPCCRGQQGIRWPRDTPGREVRARRKAKATTGNSFQGRGQQVLESPSQRSRARTERRGGAGPVGGLLGGKDLTGRFVLSVVRGW